MTDVQEGERDLTPEEAAKVAAVLREHAKDHLAKAEAKEREAIILGKEAAILRWLWAGLDNDADPTGETP